MMAVCPCRSAPPDLDRLVGGLLCSELEHPGILYGPSCEFMAMVCLPRHMYSGGRAGGSAERVAFDYGSGNMLLSSRKGGCSISSCCGSDK